MPAWTHFFYSFSLNLYCNFWKYIDKCVIFGNGRTFKGAKYSKSLRWNNLHDAGKFVSAVSFIAWLLILPLFWSLKCIYNPRTGDIQSSRIFPFFGKKYVDCAIQNLGGEMREKSNFNLTSSKYRLSAFIWHQICAIWIYLKFPVSCSPLRGIAHLITKSCFVATVIIRCIATRKSWLRFKNQFVFVHTSTRSNIFKKVDRDYWTVHAYNVIQPEALSGLQNF